MSMPGSLYGYHVHIYFDDTTKVRATDLRDTLVERFKAQPSGPKFVGIAGPHPIPLKRRLMTTPSVGSDGRECKAGPRGRG